jgi:hypothetical protein
VSKEKKAEKKDEGRVFLDLKVYRCPAGHRRAGMYSFSVGGQESHYYSSNEHGVRRTITYLLSGRPSSTVTLKAVKGRGKGKIGTEAIGKEEDPNAWADLPTMEERSQVFFNRGRLKGGELQPRKED